MPRATKNVVFISGNGHPSTSTAWCQTLLNETSQFCLYVDESTTPPSLWANLGVGDWLELGSSGGEGTVGPAGPEGPEGPQGPIGLTGPTGPKGDTGNTGLQGIQGIPGEQGEEGPQGIQGFTGNTGQTGEQGPQGDQGIQGIPGPAGADGISGLGYTLSVQALTSSPVDAKTVYFGQLPKAPVTAAATSKVHIRKAGTIKMANVYCFSGTAGTAEAWSLYIRKNNTTDTLVATVSAAATERVFTNSALSIPVVAGDYIEMKSVQPTWVTNPLTTIWGGYLYVE